MSVIRSFVAIDTPSDVKEKIAELSEKLKAAGAEVKWESREKFHITLKFLGNVEEKTLESLASRLGGHLHNIPSFNLVYQRVGCFPNLEHPRVIWVGAEEEDGILMKVREKVEEIAITFGVEREERKFHAHITIGRVKGARNLKSLSDEIGRIEFRLQNATVTEVLLMRSDLKPTGSVYTVQQRFPLKSS